MYVKLYKRTWIHITNIDELQTDLLYRAQYNVHVVDYSCQYNTKYNNHYNPEASAYNALRFCKRISIMLAIFYCIKISQTTKKKKNNFKKMYELFPNKEVLKYNHIGLNNITNGICKINTVDKLQRSAYACHWTCLLWF